MVARQATTCRKGERVGTIERAFCASEDAGPHRRNVTASSTRHLGPFGLRVSMRSARASGLRAPRCEQGDEGLGGFVGGHICLRSGASSETIFGRGRRTKSLVCASSETIFGRGRRTKSLVCLIHSFLVNTQRYSYNSRCRSSPATPPEESKHACAGRAHT